MPICAVMGYMNIKRKDDSTLVLMREPSLMSFGFYFAFMVALAPILLVGEDSIIIKLVLVAGACCLSYLILHNYEICEFDKVKSEVRTTNIVWSRYWVSSLLGKSVPPNLFAKLDDIQDVQVLGQDSKGSQVILVLKDGQKMGVTESFTSDPVSSHEAVKDVIKSFLRDGKITNQAEKDVNEGTTNDRDNEDDSSEDDFEQITHTELEMLKEGDDNVSKEKDPVADGDKKPSQDQSSS